MFSIFRTFFRPSKTSRETHLIRGLAKEEKGAKVRRGGFEYGRLFRDCSRVRDAGSVSFNVFNIPDLLPTFEDFARNSSDKGVLRRRRRGEGLAALPRNSAA
jgi:hypothetical protein